MLTKLLSYIPIWVYRKMDQDRLIGGYYHLVNEVQKPYVKNIYPYKNTQQFVSDLQFIKKNYHCISYDQFLSKSYKTGAFILTFDDGFRELKEIILPLLEQYEIPALFFITTCGIDNKNWIYRNLISLIVEEIQHRNLDEVREILVDIVEFSQKDVLILWIKKIKNDSITTVKLAEKLGIDYKKYLTEHKPYLTKDEIIELNQHPLITIGAHSTQHYHYQYMTDEEVKNDLLASCKIIQEITQQNKVPFAFPHDSIGVNRQLLADIQKENPFVEGFFGEFNFDKEDTIVIKRYPLDHPKNPIQKIIKTEGKNFLYRKFRK